MFSAFFGTVCSLLYIGYNIAGYCLMVSYVNNVQIICKYKTNYMYVLLSMILS